jgi:hypothetical protein
MIRRTTTTNNNKTKACMKQRQDKQMKEKDVMNVKTRDVNEPVALFFLWVPGSCL